MWRRFRDSPMPYQNIMPFPPEAIVLVGNEYGSTVGPAASFWWGYEEELGYIGNGVIMRAHRIDKPKPPVNPIEP